jgi:hypothetical protein
MRSLVFRSTGRNRFDAVRSFRDLRILGILERFVSARERCLDGMWRRFNLTYTRGSTNGSTQMFLSAEMDRARVKTMHVILVCTQTFTQLTLDNAEACIALMEGMIDVAWDSARAGTRIYTPVDQLNVGEIAWPPTSVDRSHTEMLLVGVINHLCAYIQTSMPSCKFAQFPTQMLVSDTSTNRA